jgi:hypothetical protein
MGPILSGQPAKKNDKKPPPRIKTDELPVPLSLPMRCQPTIIKPLEIIVKY